MGLTGSSGQYPEKGTEKSGPDDRAEHLLPQPSVRDRARVHVLALVDVVEHVK